MARHPASRYARRHHGGRRRGPRSQEICDRVANRSGGHAMIRYILAICLSLVALPAMADVEVKEITTPGGLEAWLVEEHNILFISIELRFRGGASLDAPGKRGATNLMVGLLEEGAGDLESREFAERAEALAASFEFDVGDDAVSISARFLTENQDEALALLRDAITQPRFDQTAIDRVKAQIVSSIRSDAQDPDSIIGEQFDQMVFGDHPYGSSIEGTEESLAALTREDLLA